MSTTTGSHRLSAAALALAIGATGAFMLPTQPAHAQTGIVQSSNPAQIVSGIITEGNAVDTGAYGIQSTAANNILLQPGTTTTIDTGITGGTLSRVLNPALGTAQKEWIASTTTYDPETGILTYTVPRNIEIHGPNDTLGDGEKRDVEWRDAESVDLSILEALPVVIHKDGDPKAVNVTPGIVGVPTGTGNKVVESLSGDRILRAENTFFHATNMGVKQGESLTTEKFPTTPTNIHPSWVSANADNTLLVKPGYKVGEGKYDLAYTLQTESPELGQSVSTTIISPDFFTVAAANLAGTFNPSYVDSEITPGESQSFKVGYMGNEDSVPSPEQEPEFTLDNFTAPRGWVVSIQPNGEITVTSPSSLSSTSMDIPVLATYPDGTTDRLKLTVSYTSDMAADYTYTYPAVAKVRIKDTATFTPAVKYKDTDNGTTPEGTVFSIQEADPTLNLTINKDTGEITARPDLGATLGSIPVSVSVAYPDNTSETVKMNVLVEDQLFADRTAFTYPTRTVPREGNIAINPEFTPSLPTGTTFTIGNEQPWIVVDEHTGVVRVAPGTVTPLGEHSYTIVAHYPDGSTNNTQGKVSVSAMKDSYAVSYDIFEVKQGKTVSAKPNLPTNGQYGFSAGGGFPEWAILDANTGEVTIKPDYTVSPGTKSLAVNVSYPDGSRGDTTINFTVVKENQNNYLSPGYAPLTVQAGKNADSSSPNYVGGVPQGAPTYEIVDTPWATVDKDGIVTVSPEATMEAGSHDVQVKITYSDGSVDTAVLKVTVESQPLKDVYSPSYDTITAKQFGQGVGKVSYAGDKAPQSATYSAVGTIPSWISINNKTGNILINPTFEQTVGEQRIDIRVTYSDGTVDRVSVPITITAGEARDRYDFSYPAGTVKQAESATLTPVVSDSSAGGVSAPAGEVAYQLAGDNPEWASIDSATGVVTVKPSLDVRMGDYKVFVEATYKDGTKDTTTAGVKVTGTTDAIRYELVYAKGIVEQGSQLDGKAPARTTGAAAPEGTTIIAVNAPSWVKMNRDGSYVATPDYTVVPGDYATLVTITYPDGSTEQITSTVSVTRAEVSKEFNNPSYPDSTVVQGREVASTPPKSDSRSLPKGTTYKLRYNAQKWASVDPNTGIVTAKPGYDVNPGSYDVPVAVVFPDGSQLPVSWRVVVAQGKMSDGYNPTYAESIKVVQGAQVTLATPISQGSLLPEGTKFNAGEGNPSWTSVGLDGTVSAAPGADVKPGNYTALVVVAYKDGTTDDITVPIEVVQGKVQEGKTDVKNPVDKSGFKDYSNPHTPEWKTSSGGMSLSDLPEGWTVSEDGTIRDEKGNVVEGAKVGEDGKLQTTESGAKAISDAKAADAKNGKSVNTGGNMERVSLVGFLKNLFK